MYTTRGRIRFRVGDHVVAFVGSGGFATDLVAKESSVAPLPPGMDFVTASSFLVAYGTADYALRVRQRKEQPPAMPFVTAVDVCLLEGLVVWIAWG